ncbi:MAG: hypothetical protein JSS27_08000 [Planctomycetes bacterium]|nr:hypothetical protein [Planctomycetota bacterium]
MTGNTGLKPYMTEEEAQIIDSFLLKYQPRRCLEWGIGGSTVVFSRHSFIEQWIGIEWHHEWIRKVQPFVSPRVQLHEAKPPSTECPYGCQVSIDTFVNHPAITGSFDFIFIDGDYR